MPALGFKKQFEPLIISGDKPHTIRAPRKNPIRPGQKIFHYFGMRTIHCRKFGESLCSDVQEIEIHCGSALAVKINGNPLLPHEIIRLAQRDGFKSTADFFSFFRKTHGEKFTGQLIHWKDFQPVKQ